MRILAPCAALLLAAGPVCGQQASSMFVGNGTPGFTPDRGQWELDDVLWWGACGFAGVEAEVVEVADAVNSDRIRVRDLAPPRVARFFATSAK